MIASNVIVHPTKTRHSSLQLRPVTDGGSESGTGVHCARVGAWGDARRSGRGSRRKMVGGTKMGMCPSWVGIVACGIVARCASASGPEGIAVA